MRQSPHQRDQQPTTCLDGKNRQTDKLVLLCEQGLSLFSRQLPDGDFSILIPIRVFKT